MAASARAEGPRRGRHAPHLTVLAASLVAALAGSRSGGAVTALFTARGDASGTIDGPASFGSRMAMIDLDGDGIRDLVADAPSDGPIGRWNAGTVSVLRGPIAVAGTRRLASDPADTTVLGAMEWIHLALAGIGDLDGDGRTDLVVASWELSGRSLRVQVLLGRPAWPATIDLATTAPDVAVLGTVAAPIHSALVADLDDDGRDDIVLGGGDRAMILFGRVAWPAVIDLARDVPDVVVSGLHDRTNLLAAGDVTGDGLGELVFCPETFAEPAFVVLGRSAWPARVDLVTNPSEKRTLPGTTGGRNDAVIGALVGDPVADLVISGGNATLVFEGGATLGISGARVVIRPPDGTLELTPLAVADLDDDGLADLLLGSAASGARQRVTASGALRVLRGPLTAATVDLSTAEADLLVIGGPAEVLQRGIIGDLDSDGRPELVAAGLTAGDLHLFPAPDLTPTPPPPVIHVDAASGADTRDGVSWATAKRTVAAALDALDFTLGPATVRVAEGVYDENLIIGEDTTLVGGFPRGGGERDVIGHETVLDGGARWSVIEMLATRTGHGSVLDGVTVTNGRAPNGGGIVVHGGSPVIVNTVVRGNVAVASQEPARGATCIDADGNFVFGFPCVGGDCPPCGRECSGNGCGVYVAGGSAQLVNDLIHDNAVELIIAGPSECSEIPAGASCALVPECELAFGAGGGVFVDSEGFATVRSTTLSRNDGGGLVAQWDTSFGALDGDVLLDVQDSVLFGNATADVRLLRPAKATVRNSVVGTVSGGSLGAGCLRTDPRFVDAPNGDFHLAQLAAGQSVQSPAVDAGSVQASQACLPPAGAPCLEAATTRSDAMPDSGRLDMGYHHPLPNLPPVFVGASAARASGECAIEVTWSAARDPERERPLRYDVYRGTSPRGEDFATPVGTVAEPALAFIDSTVAFGATYYYVVRAQDASGRAEANTVEVSATAIDTRGPEVPSLDASPAGGCDVELALVAVSACSGVARTELHRSTLSGFVPDATTLVATDPAAPVVDMVTGNGRYHYRVVIVDGAGQRGISPQADVRVDGCVGGVPPPGEARVVRVSVRPAGIEVEIIPAPGAVFHRLLRGNLLTLPLGYDHGVSAGGDAMLHTADDVGDCDVAGTVATDPTGRTAGSFYYLAVGVNASGTGVHGLDSYGRAAADGTTGAVSCP